MTTPAVSSALPDDDGVRYERVDDLTVLVYVEGADDTTVRPAHPAVQKMLERDHEQIAQMIARTRREQDRLNTRSHLG
jgi:hypothetical protein